MRVRLCCLWLIGATMCLLSIAATSAVAQAPVSLEVITQEGMPLERQPQWLEALKKIGFTSVRMRSAQASEEPVITNRGTDDNPRYTVIGVLTSDNQLHLPGLTVRPGQREQLEQWLTRLREGGEDAVTGAQGAFGLTAKQFVTLHDAVKPGIEFETKGKSVHGVVKQIVDSMPVTVELDATAQAALAGNEQVPDELRGLSRGTALAAAVRPLGLIVTVTGQGRRAGGLRVAKPTSKDTAWPVGIAPGKDAPPDELVPALFKFINVEINERPLTEALHAIQGRIEIPVLWDHNALAKHAVDVQTKVSFAPKKTFYKRIIDDLLYQAMLRSELRVDDADKPFLWITTIKN
jgi:hypothetical protein